jgi:hypothetical protein
MERQQRGAAAVRYVVTDGVMYRLDGETLIRLH